MGYVASFSLTSDLIKDWEEVPRTQRSALVQRLLREEFSGSTTKLTKSKPKPKEDLLADVPDDLKQAVGEFIEFRKSSKRAMTALGVKKMLAILEQLFPGNTRNKIASIDRSIANGWLGVFNLEEDPSKPRKESLLQQEIRRRKESEV